jgi:hypothetical protein
MYVRCWDVVRDSESSSFEFHLRFQISGSLQQQFWWFNHCVFSAINIAMETTQ